MKKLACLLFILAPLAQAQTTPWTPTCLDAATQTQITTAVSSLTASVGLDLTDSMLRLADQRCTLSQITVGMLADIDTLKKAVANIPAGPKGDTGNPGPPGPPAFTPYAVPTGYVIPVIADQMSGGCLFTGGKCTGWTSIKGGGLYGQELIFGGTAGDSGSFYDYSIVVPQAGNYGVSLNVAITTGTSSFTGHFECPIGTPIGSVSYSNAGLTNPANPFVAKIGSVTLPAGPQTLRFVLDTAPAGNSSGMVNWYYFAKLP